MRVKVRAVVPVSGGIVIAREIRQGMERRTLPGGRPVARETLPQALVREVLEETGLVVEVGPLLYVTEVVSGRITQDINLVFLAHVAGGDIGPDADVVGQPTDDVKPPILDHIFEDLAAGWRDTPRWLGNVHAMTDTP